MERKLTQKLEREVAIAYLCKVSPEYIHETYKVSEPTVRQLIVGKYSREWNDPLVEFYRSTGNKERNSAHLFLSFKARESIKPEGLVQKPRDFTLNQIVEDAVYWPLISETLKRTALGGYTAQETNYGRFLSRVLPNSLGREVAIIETWLLKELKEIYEQTNNQSFSLKNVSRRVNQKIFKGVAEGGLAWTESKRRIVDGAVGTLSEKQKQVMEMSFGFGRYNKGKTTGEISKELDTTPARVLDIKENSLRKLRNPFIYVNLRILDSCFDNLIPDVGMDKELSEPKKYFPKTETCIKRDLSTETPNIYDAKLIEELDLSLRAHNCLSGGGISTVGELRKLGERGLMRTRNIGRKSLKEIKEVLEGLGIRID